VVRPATVTERERRVLRWVAEQYAAPMGVVAELVGREGVTPAAAEAVARRLAARLEGGRLARRERLYGAGVWLIPTARGLRELDLEWPLWRPANGPAGDGKLGHIAMVARLRLHLESLYSSAAAVGWESERAIRSRLRGQERRRRADGGFYLEGRWYGIELELHLKARRFGANLPPSARDPYLELVQATDPVWRRVWWFTPWHLKERLRERLAANGGGERHHVYALPPEVRP
jgi:hypothetical protein